VEEREAVGGVRPAVDVQDERVLLRGVEARRLLDEGVDLLAVEAGVPELLGSGEEELREQS
jgi:hypothetical protein